MRARAAPPRLLSYFTRHRTAANLLLLVLLALGAAALPRMRAQFFPDVVLDSLSVTVAWPGAGAEDVDLALVGALEPALLAVRGVTDVSSRASEGSASISLEFEPGRDMSAATEDVQAAVDAVRDLPDAAQEPVVRRSAWSDRVTDTVIHGPIAPQQLARLADAFTARLFAAGVTQVTIEGIAAAEIRVEVPSISLIRHGLSLSQIAAAIAEEAEADPAGDIAGAARVRTGVAKRSAEQIAGIALRSGMDGTRLELGDVARITQPGIDRDRASFVGPDPALTLRVERSAEGDAIELQRRVEAVAAQMRPTLPEGVEITLVRTRAEAITGRLDTLMENGLMGLGLVVGLLFFFLNARTAFWVAAGIPVAMTAAIALMYAAGLTFNMISLFALIITLGIVVDDAIVVGEHADFRARQLGEDAKTAAENAAGRMFAPVFSATLTTVIAFFGLVAVGGRFGDLISDIPFTVIVVLIASLAECFLILPNHMAHALSHVGRGHWYDWPSRTVNKGFGVLRDKGFRPLMRLVVKARYPVLAAVIAILASQVAVFMRGDVQWRFFNAPERSTITGNFVMRDGATRADTLEMMRALQRSVAETGAAYEAEHGRDPVDFAIAQIGGTAGRGLAGTEETEPERLGAISIELIPADARPYSSFAFLAALQEAVPEHPLLETVSYRGGRSGPGGDALDIRISGAASQTLKAAAEDLKARLGTFPEVSALEDSLPYDKEEIILELTARGRALGFTIDALGDVLRDRLSGIEAASFPDGPRAATIRVELAPRDLTPDLLDRMLLPTAEGQQVPLADIVTLRRAAGFSSIRRENGVRLARVTGDLSEDDPARASEIMQALETVILPRLEEDFGVSTALSGLSEQEDAFLADAALGLAFCLTGIYLTLAWVFSSWLRPFVVMAIIPFGLVGTIWGHAAWDVPLSLFTVVGLLGMTGIIINDSIVLVTTIDEHAHDRGLVPAIVDGAADRLRPVLLTTLTTVLGLAPLLYETSADAQFLKPTVITLVYGLGFGMLLVLLVVPALIGMQHDARRSLDAVRRSLRGGRRHRAVRRAVSLTGMAALAGFALVLLPAILWERLPMALGGAALGPAAGFALYMGLTVGTALLALIGTALSRRRR
ncbi:efflux RND transporter permease subunit [Profundibacterium mesophilum]|uniref:Cationmultidrug efflux pump n=1 Tax=Profundibacterium mesophilum KAUST100406-0324 TaxID=1037889 RepID=A0A921NUY5_9RHOB|nr:efflux RND transporter permease subunit [Profundibacterium mesophilum]KAF0675970.1 Cationmultidrug efflux pump [Profundibacterium mesophilum KAUST100406-0324]